MHKSSKHKQPWSDWQLDPDSQQYYRFYVDSNGKTIYQWDGPESSQPDVPRQPPPDDIAGISEGMRNLPIEDHPYDTHQGEGYTHTGSSKSKSKSSKSKSKGKQREQRNDYEQGEYSNDDPSYQHTQGGGQQSYAQDTSRQDAYQDPGSSYFQDPSGSVGQGYDPTTGGYYQSHGSSNPGTGQYDEDEDVRAAMAESRGYNTGSQYAAGESSSQQAPYYEPYDYGEDPPNRVDQGNQSHSYNAASYSAGESSNQQGGYYDPYDYGDDPTSGSHGYEDEGTRTPRAGDDPGMSNMIEQLEECGELDPRYRVQPSSMFQPGAIFKVYWAEPEGSSKDSHGAAVSTKHEFQNKYGTKFYFGFRRFIVVANDQGHSTCVPVLTYGGKACKKRGVKPEKHGIIHERNHKARLIDKEPKLGFRPVRVDITEEGEKLARESRVNYSKLVTVEHNVRVFFIGNIYTPDFDIVSDAVNSCWEAKIHHKKKHKSHGR